ncbi:hypothetical protein GC176_27225 [bacterium]|nr:hypothetical protein [bacterium]
MDADFAALAVVQLWQVTLLIVIVAVANRWLSRRRPHLAHVLWLVVLAKCLTPPLWSSTGGIFCWLQPERIVETQAAQLDVEWQMVKWQELIVVDAASNEPASEDADPFAAVPLSDAEAAELLAPEEATGRQTVWPVVVATLWLGSVLAVLLVIVVRWWRFWRQLTKAPRRECAELESQLDKLARQLGVKRVRLLVTESRIGPAVVGLFRKTILLPAVVVDRLSSRSQVSPKPGDVQSPGEFPRGDSIRSSGASPDELRVSEKLAYSSLLPILAHELLHVRRGDLWIGLLQTIAQAVWWFHPLVWWVGRLTNREAERCCDEEVLAELKCDPATYARSLLHVLELKSQLAPVPVFPGVRPVDVTSKRLERIMTLRQGCRRRTPWWCWLIAIGTAALTLPGGAFVVSAADEAVVPPETESESATECDTCPNDGVDQERTIDRQPESLNVVDTSIKSDRSIHSPEDAEDKTNETRPESVNETRTHGVTGRTLHIYGEFHVDVASLTDSVLSILRISDQVRMFRMPVSISVYQPEITRRFGPKTARLVLRADQCEMRWEPKTLVIELSCNSALSTSLSSIDPPTEAVGAKADSIRLTIPIEVSSGGIRCQMKNAVMAIGGNSNWTAWGQSDDSASTILRAGEVDLMLDRDSLVMTEMSARKVGLLRPATASSVDVPTEITPLSRPAGNMIGDEWDRLWEEASLRQLVSLKFDCTPLIDVMRSLGRSAGLNVVIDEAEIQQAGVAALTPVTIDLENIWLPDALGRMLKPLQLGVVVDDHDRVVVTSGQRMRGKLVAAAYPVADLVVPIPRTVVVHADETKTGREWKLAERQGGVVPAGAVQPPPKAALEFDELVSLIQSTVEPDSWTKRGGRGTINFSETTLSLIIRQTQPVHEKISDLLGQLRRVRDVTVRLQVETLRTAPDGVKQAGIEAELRPLGDSATCKYARLTTAQAEQLRSDAEVSLLPKVTLFNGQTGDLFLPERGGHRPQLRLQPTVSVNRQFVRLAAGFNGGRKKSADEVTPPVTVVELPPVSEDEAILLEVTEPADPDAPIVGVSASEKSRRFRAVRHRRSFMLIQADILNVEEKEDLLNIEP